jgi:hypothetical protein
VNVRVPDYLHRWVRSEAGMTGLGMAEYVARALRAQVDRDRAEREDDEHNEEARVEEAKAEAQRALSHGDA